MIMYEHANVRDVIPHTSTDFVLVKNGNKPSQRCVVNIKNGKPSYTAGVGGQPTVFVRDGDSIILRCGARFYCLTAQTKQIPSSGRNAFYSVFDSGTIRIRQSSTGMFSLRDNYRIELYPLRTRYVIRKYGHPSIAHDIAIPIDRGISETSTRRSIAFNVSESRLLMMSTLVSQLAMHKFYLRRQLAHYSLGEREEEIDSCMTNVCDTKISLPTKDHWLKPEILAGAARPFTDGRIGWVDYTVEPDSDFGQIVVSAANKSNDSIQHWIICAPLTVVGRNRQLSQLYYFDAQDDLLAWCSDDMIVVQDNYGERMRVIPEEKKALRGCRISPDQQTVWCWSQNFLYVLDVE